MCDPEAVVVSLHYLSIIVINMRCRFRLYSCFLFNNDAEGIKGSNDFGWIRTELPLTAEATTSF